MADLCFVTTCMGRLAALRQSLGPMVAQGGSCIVVEYSCPESAGDWVEANHKAARVIRVPGQDRFNASAARNVGAACRRRMDLFRRFGRGSRPRFFQGDAAHACTRGLLPRVFVRPGFGRHVHLFSKRLRSGGGL